MLITKEEDVHFSLDKMKLEYLISSLSYLQETSLNIESSTMPNTNTSSDMSPATEEISPVPDDTDNIVNKSVLPWQDNLDPSPTHLADSIPNNEPVIAHVPSWVNNLSYSHITETGSPYVSPQTTIIPPASDYHKTIYSLFSELSDKTEDVKSDLNNVQQSVNSSDYFPNPWGESVSEDCPQVSPMAMESAIRSEDLLHSTHSEQAPDHHHVIIPTTYHLFIDSASDSEKHQANLTEVASAPDFQHWKPLSKSNFLENCIRQQSDSMLSEMALQEGIKTRVAQWLKQSGDDEENDADGETDDDDDDDDDDNDKFYCTADGLDSADELERELDLAMSLNKKEL